MQHRKVNMKATANFPALQHTQTREAKGFVSTYLTGD